MNWTDRRNNFRTMIEGQRCVFPASVYDGISRESPEKSALRR